MHTRYVAYYRVSTQKQGRSGLGLDAQKQSVQDFISQYQGKLIAEYTEVESGKNSNRPVFKEAADYAELTNSIILVAKLDRIARDLHFITALQKQGVKFKLCDLPEVDNLTVHILAAMAEHEAKMIASRTKLAMAQAKQKGIVLGNPKLDEVRNKSVTQANHIRVTAQQEWKAKIVRVINSLSSCGSTCKEIAQELNQRGLTTYRGKAFTVPIVSKLLRENVHE